ncbi:AAA family ATPase [Thiothrix subterranea]|uniref:AAA family ATPase n=1 Tax=Thiothrix subterranea TaxID=2735563 RepID=UPI00192B6790|nr:AAA family ATPase [Thiothrix subterranea]QQZ29628.1 AAA family ATPase [Thiothrix subterranea]
MITFPYGISDFNHIRSKGMLYVDRTACISRLEAAGQQLVFLRPRRFGKSLLLSTLANYYDISTAGEFEALFGGLAVGNNPTPEHNQYLILRWDFSKVSGQGDVEQIKQNLFNHLNDRMTDFVQNYQALLKFPVRIRDDDALATLESLSSVVKNSGHTVYLLIDEYDNFANEVLVHDAGNTKRYYDLLESEGIVKTLFKVIKGSVSEGKISRVFITGVSPLVLSDVTSGYNVSTNISLDEDFNGLCGVSEEELSGLVSEVLQDCGLPDTQAATVLDTMRQFYNGYRFCADASFPTVYNPTLCFYFLRAYQKRCKPPAEMLDGNLAMDASRVRYIASLPEGGNVIANILDEQNPVVLPYLETQFGVEQLHKLQTDPRYMASLLYFFGVLTIGGTAGPLEEMKLEVPNRVIFALYVETLREQVLPDLADRRRVEALAKQFYQTADLHPLADYLETSYFKAFNNRDYRWGNELTIKTAFMSLLYDDMYYIMDSEAAVQRRYADLLMIIRPDQRRLAALQDFVMEFKYIKLKALGLTAEEVRAQSREALQQLPVVQAALQAALLQLKDYRRVLVEKYREPHRLHCLAVVALGFERLVWEVLA